MNGSVYIDERGTGRLEIREGIEVLYRLYL